MKSAAVVLLKITLVVLMSVVEPLANLAHHHLQDHTHQEEYEIEVNADKKRQILVLQ
jgi:hypothetical protein